MMSPPLLALAALLAQASADPGPGPAGPPPAVPGPTASRPSGPAEAAPPETSGPAEQAPPDPGAPGTPQPPVPATPTTPDIGPETPPRNTVALLGGVSYRLTSTALSPSVGFTIGGAYQRRYATLASAVELGWAVEFAFDRFSTGVIGSAPDANGVEQTYAATRTITSTSFAVLQTLAVHQDRFRLWMGAGAGLSIGFFSSPELDLRPGIGQCLPAAGARRRRRRRRDQQPDLGRDARRVQLHAHLVVAEDRQRPDHRVHGRSLRHPGRALLSFSLTE